MLELGQLVATAAAGLPVRVVWVFGSVARGDARPGSDLDLAVLPAAGAVDGHAVRLQLQAALSGAGYGEVDVVLVDQVPLRLQARIAAEGQVIFSTDEPARLAWTSRVFREHADFALLQDQLDQEMLRAHADGRR